MKRLLFRLRMFLAIRQRNERKPSLLALHIKDTTHRRYLA